MELHAVQDFSQAVADEVRAEIAVQRRTAGELASELGIGPHTMGRRLSGQSPFSVTEMAQAAVWLGMTPDALTRRAERRAARARRLVAKRLAS